MGGNLYKQNFMMKIVMSEDLREDVGEVLSFDYTAGFFAVTMNTDDFLNTKV